MHATNLHSLVTLLVDYAVIADNHGFICNIHFPHLFATLISVDIVGGVHATWRLMILTVKNSPLAIEEVTQDLVAI